MASCLTGSAAAAAAAECVRLQFNKVLRHHHLNLESGFLDSIMRIWGQGRAALCCLGQVTTLILALILKLIHFWVWGTFNSFWRRHLLDLDRNKENGTVNESKQNFPVSDEEFSRVVHVCPAVWKNRGWCSRDNQPNAVRTIQWCK